MLTEKQWNEAEDKYLRTGCSYHQIAKELGVSYASVQKHAQKREWQKKRTLQCENSLKELMDAAGKDKVEYAKRIYSVTDDLLVRCEQVIQSQPILILSDLETLAKILKIVYQIQLGGKTELDIKEQEARLRMIEKELSDDTVDKDLIVKFTSSEHGENAEDYAV